MPFPLPQYEVTKTRAWSRLGEMAKAPHDLTAPDGLSAQRLARCKVSGCGWDLLYATQRVDEQVLDALLELAHETQARERLAALMAGEVMNRMEGYPGENRAVLHATCRDLFPELKDAPASGDATSRHPVSTTARENAAQALEDSQAQMDRLKDFMSGLEGGPFTDLIHIGIGGSDQGPRAIYQALKPHGNPQRRVHFVSNIDPDDLAETLNGLDLSRTLVNVVSKSGSTLETLTNETLARSAYQSAGLNPGQHFICVTGKGSPMDDPTRYRAIFHLFDYIGGRFSSTSMVGGVPLAFGLGLPVFMEFLQGARRMDLHALQSAPAENLPLLAALLGIWNRNFLKLPTLAVLPYSHGLSRFVAHLQQLDMESNGKGVTQRGTAVDFDTGPIVWGEPGTNGQHAFYQLIHQSPTVIPCEFIGFRQSRYGQDAALQGTTSQQKLLANLLAQSLALATGHADENPNRHFAGNRPSLTLMADKLTPHTLGSLLSLYEQKVAYQGLIWGINSFDQEGVQLGKALALGLLDELKRPVPAREKSASTLEKEDSLNRALLKAAGLL